MLTYFIDSLTKYPFCFLRVLHHMLVLGDTWCWCQTPKENMCGVVYHIKCKDCTVSYIGETGRQVKTRVKEHWKPSSSGYDSAVYEHLTTQGHWINWDNIRILDTEDRDLPRKVKEATQIRRHNPEMNRYQGYNLPQCYNVPVPTLTPDVTQHQHVM